MEEEARLPEDVIDHILTFLPVKSLLRFTLVSKRFCALILYDPKFAKSQLHVARHRKTVGRHKILYTKGVYPEGLRFESMDLKTTSFGDPSSERVVKAPFVFPTEANTYVWMLGSCNGVVFTSLNDEVIYMWNPLTGFGKKLPHSYFICRCPYAHGVGYSPATDDYKLVIFYEYDTNHEEIDEAFYYSSRADAWKPVDLIDAIPLKIATMYGTFFNDALHWITSGNQILAFDLEQQDNHKLRNMLLPKSFDFDVDKIFGNVGVIIDGDQQCLSLARFKNNEPEHIQIWIMKEYGVRDSWTKLFDLKFTNPLRNAGTFSNRGIRTDVVIMESGMVMAILGDHICYCSWLVNGALNVDETLLCTTRPLYITAIEYEESLIRVDH